LVPDLGDELRAPVAFTDGQKICFEAYNVSSPATAVDSKIYSWSTGAGKFIPDTDPLGVVPDGATTYRFVAYSYFGEAEAPSTTIDLSRDLVWGKSTDRTVGDTETSRTATINMTHLFARVKVLVKSGISTVTITDLRDVEIEGSTWTTVNPFDGSFGTASAVKQWIEFDEDVLPAEEIESGQRLVFPVTTAPAKVKFGTIEVSATTPFSDQTVKFNSTLDAGRSYTLVVDVKRCVWSRSNIYWQEVTDDQDPKYPGYLTFVPAGVDLTKQGYQGVSFRWGSLVGISPATTTGAGNDGRDFSGSTDIYVPIVDATTLTNSTWKATTGNAMKNDGDFPTVTSDWNTWTPTSTTSPAPATDIPYFDGVYGRFETGDHDNTFVMDAAQNNETTYQGFRGDICQYLSKTGAVSGNYRLPTASEFGTALNSYPWSNGNASLDGWIKGTGSFIENNSAGYADGTADLLDDAPGKNGGNTIYGSGINKKNGNVVLPASGYRNASTGTLMNVGDYGFYWSCSTWYTANAADSYYFVFYSMYVLPIVGSSRNRPFPVRCVQN
jgi:hypothetical protein